jgi:hypothetical protein
MSALSFSSLGATSPDVDFQHNGSIGATTVTGGTAPYTILWTSGSSSTPITQQTLAAKSALAAASYVLKVTDSAATPAVITNTFTIAATQNLTITPDTVTNGTINADGSVSSGQPPYVGAWKSLTNGATVIGTTSYNPSGGIPVTNGSYKYTVTDAYNASVSATTVVTASSVQPISITGGVSSVSGGVGAISAITVSGGVAPYTFSWTSTNGASNITTQDGTAKSNLSAGTYSLSITGSGVPYPAVYTNVYNIVTGPLAITPGAVTNNITGMTVGSIGATTISGGQSPYTVAWTSSNGGTTITTQTPTAKQNLAGGSYTITVTDSASATATYTYTLTNVPATALTVVAGNTKHQPIHANSGGYVGASVAAGGLAPYTISWTGPDVSSKTDLKEITNARAGTYVVTIKDANNTTITQTFTVLFGPKREYHSYSGDSSDRNPLNE